MEVVKETRNSLTSKWHVEKCFFLFFLCIKNRFNQYCVRVWPFLRSWLVMKADNSSLMVQTIKRRCIGVKGCSGKKDL